MRHADWRPAAIPSFSPVIQGQSPVIDGRREICAHAYRRLTFRALPPRILSDQEVRTPFIRKEGAMSQVQSQTLDLEVRAPVAGRYADILSTRRLAICRAIGPRVWPAAGRTAPQQGKTAARNRRRATSRFPCRDGAHPPGRLDGGPHTRPICRTAAWKSPVPRTGK